MELLPRLWRGDLLTEDEAKSLCVRARDILIDEKNIETLSTPIVVCGDIHGQFPDLLELFKIGGSPPETKYLFVGDFVDRGFYSVETVLLLFALKVQYPDRIWLVRGNHESRQITQVYGFYDEVLRKFGDPAVWRYCVELFDYLPLAATVNETTFCVHGGLSPQISSLDEIRCLDRKQEVPHEGPMCDLLWSDPEEMQGWGSSPRGAGFLFGGDVLKSFSHNNGLNFTARAHQLVMEGYRVMFNDTLATVWSAPNYCYRCGNVASVLVLSDDGKREFRTFSAASLTDRPPPAKTPVPEYFL